jgi:hypothetical protein
MNKARMTIIISILLSVLFILSSSIFKSFTIWLYGLGMITIFSALTFAIREQAATSQAFWKWMAISFGIIIGSGVIIFLTL